MDHASFDRKLTQLKALFPLLKFPLFSERGAPQCWNAFTTEPSQPLEPLSRMDRAPSAEGALDTTQQLQQQLHKQIYLRETIQRIRRVFDAEGVCRSAVQGMMDFFQADWVLMLEHGPLHWQPIAQSFHPLTSDNSAALNTYLELETVAVQLGRSSPIAVDEQSLKQIPVYKYWLHLFPGACLLVPIHLLHSHQSRPAGGPWGLVAVGRKDKTSPWSVEQQEQAKILVDEVAIALGQSLLYDKLKQDNQDLKALALTDSLTGLANRRQFDSYFQAEWQRLAREQQPLTLILCDIDYFKRYNDYYGHQTGDVCLAEVSNALRRCIRRPADLVARYGGEEFVVILPNTDTEGGYNVALAIQQQLEKAAIPHATSTVTGQVTLTMGIATVVPEHQMISQNLLRAADLALYHAKQQGRDRIYVHAHYCVPNADRSKARNLQPGTSAPSVPMTDD